LLGACVNCYDLIDSSRPLQSEHAVKKAETSMNRHTCRLAPGLGFVLCVSACSNNGALFDDVPVLTSDTGDEPAQPSPPAAAAEDPGLPPLPESSPGRGELDGVDLPFNGQVPLPVTPGSDSAPSPPGSQAPEGPVIVSVSPADGALGVSGDASIVIRFSEPMDREDTEAAYQSESVPSGSVSFAWSEDDTELTITSLEPLAYDVGEDPSSVQARRVSYFISASARSAGGRQLSQPYEYSFFLLRQVVFTAFAVEDRELSGNFRSNDTYGAGSCAFDEDSMCVGDVRVDGESEQYRGFISFELPAVPGVPLELRADLGLEIASTSGNPFAGLGELLLEQVRFDAIGLEAFSAEPLSSLGGIAGAGGTFISADVTAAVLSDLTSDETPEAGARLSQFRLRFEDATDGDRTSDAIVSAVDTIALDVTYLLP
jgi:hypothetical protein